MTLVGDVGWLGRWKGRFLSKEVVVVAWPLRLMCDVVLGQALI